MAAFGDEMSCMGKPMTPRPRKATLAMSETLGFAPALLSKLPNGAFGKD
jgi:hypothetical protein